MKKTYINPNMVVVTIMHTQPIAGSLTPAGATFFDEDATGDAMVKGNSVSDVNVWDNEW